MQNIAKYIKKDTFVKHCITEEEDRLTLALVAINDFDPKLKTLTL